MASMSSRGQKISSSMKTRFSDVKTASSTACNWLFAKPEDEHWLDRNRFSEHHGLLWIRGKPGSGKSTIMKYAAHAAMSTKLPATVITSFFNARGALFKKSTLRMYWSLLLQILDQIPTALDDSGHLFQQR